MYKLIINPISGKGSAALRIPLIKALFEKYSLDYELVTTERVGHAAELAERASGEKYKAVIAAGGDGTANEVLNGLMKARMKGRGIPAMGIIPLGRGNDFAYGVNVPADPEEVCRIIAEEKMFPMDVGRIVGGFYPEGRFFGNGVGIGFDAVVGLEAAKMKNVHGFLAYVLGAAKTFFLFPEPPELEIECNGAVLKQKSPQISIMNGKRMGGTFFMAPESSYNDGLLDLMVVNQVNRLEMAKIIGLITKGTQRSHQKVRTDRSSRILIRSRTGRMVTHADGETICLDGRELKIECLPAQLKILSSAG
ncbi:MAG: diacylglycerol kinase family lipid kinase [Spirochaetales bacterium]|nr:diacylglycerol kinase family lipid kinase [Spirochaetales bacterium]